VKEDHLNDLDVEALGLLSTALQDAKLSDAFGNDAHRKFGEFAIQHTRKLIDELLDGATAEQAVTKFKGESETLIRLAVDAGVGIPHRAET
jgi:hypothetical protein